MGRVCYHPCETACNRGQLDEAVGINSVERFLGDEAIRRGWSVEVSAPPSGKRVLVVGAGPSGLSAAYHLALAGHAVTIRDAGPRPGGMMRFGIPRYRLPREVLDAEIDRILGLGVELQLDSKVDDLLAAMRDGGFDAAFVAVGAHLGKRAYIPAGSAARMLDAVSLLRSMEDEAPPLLGRRVVVYGGGDTAVDAARTAKRLGAEEAVIVYRRTRDRMPAHDFEVEEALEEGVLVKWLSTVRRADGGRLVLERMELDDDGFPQPTGRARGARGRLARARARPGVATSSLLERVDGVEIADGVVHVGEDLMTGHPGVFAGGDIVPAERTVTTGDRARPQAARHVDAWLRGTRHAPPPEGPLADFDGLNTWYYADAPQDRPPAAGRSRGARRRSTRSSAASTTDTALFEARRCLSCGSCFACDNCFGVCPDNAVIKLDPAGPYAYAFDLDYCKGCGLCAQECPCGAIEMEPEPI